MSSKRKIEENNEEESFSLDRMITYFLIACTIIIGVLTLLLFYDGISVNKEKRISDYISASDKILKDAEQLTEPFKLYANGENDNFTLAEKDLETMKQKVAEAKALDAPREFLEHKDKVNAILTERYAAVYGYSLGNRSRQVAGEKFEQIAKLEEEEKDSLITAMDRANIDYEQLEDGTIRFYFKTY
ncbi:hypothetical protein JOC95_001696 [Bacillus tianshenii]|uniref:Uncharacterized protein n=1 Tax=Sutcliffiella tianshenii TaxID=1463404 RepID=A0ABS2NYT2_9BACI|nr:hypothetical protein [Bacillus tianshenii]MBM7619844.1 hypothetical protein [Bacillus tianshenii]